jgi:hypothetical protein
LRSTHTQLQQCGAQQQPKQPHPTLTLFCSSHIAAYACALHTLSISAAATGLNPHCTLLSASLASAHLALLNTHGIHNTCFVYITYT